MATGRIGVTPTLRTRWSDQPATGTTVLSGLDDNSVALVYDVGYEAVYRNGVLQSRGNDYTATDGTTITLLSATLGGDIIEVFANDLVPLTDAISKGQYNAKGALLSATAASTPGVLAVGTNNQILTADSTTATGLKWATPSVSADSFSVLANTTFSAVSSLSFTSLSVTNSIMMYIRFTDGGGTSPTLRINSDSGSNYRGYMAGWNSGGSSDNGSGYTTNDTSAVLARKWTTGGHMIIRIDGVGSSGRKAITSWYNSGSGSAQSAASYNSASTLSSFEITWGTGTTGDYILLGA